MNIPDTLLKPRNIIASILVMPLFVMLFAVVYNPMFGHGADDPGVQLWIDHAEFCITILSTITLGVVGVSRLIFYFAARRTSLNLLQYLFWQLIEFAILCLFADLFLSLYFHQKYFVLLPTIMLYGALILFFPYIISWLYFRERDLEHQLAASQQRVHELQLGMEKSEQGAIKFVDEKGTVRLVVNASRIVYIESAGNYVNIVYEDSGRLVRFSLRNTLKGIEQVCSENDLVRCHRSYFINLHKVKILRKGPEGVFAEMDAEGVSDIPVSKSFANEVIRLFNL